MATRLYFHAATDSTSGLPTAEQSSLTANDNAEGSQTTNRQMTTTIGVSETSLNVTPTGSATRNQYYTRFVSPALNMTAISANTWTYNFAAREDDTSNNFPVSGTNQPVRVNCYVWRPSNTSKIGTILDGNTASTVDEQGANDKSAHHVTFSGSAVASMVTGDVIIFEVWFITVSSASVGAEDRFFYDGTTENTTDNATVTNHASFLETPETLVFDTGEPAATPEPNKTSHTNIGNARGILELSGRRPIIFIGALMEDLIENFTRIMIRKWVHYLNPILARFRGKSFISPVDSIQLTQS